MPVDRMSVFGSTKQLQKNKLKQSSNGVVLPYMRFRDVDEAISQCSGQLQLPTAQQFNQLIMAESESNPMPLRLCSLRVF